MAAAGLALGTVGVVPAVPASAVSSGASAVCSVGFGGVGGYYESGSSVFATVPPTTSQGLLIRNPYKGTVRLSGPVSSSKNGEGNYDVFGLVVLGDTLYTSYVIANADDGEILAQALARIGGGWSSYVALETSGYRTPGRPARSSVYGLRGDGVLFRWTNGWRDKTSYPGFSAVKSMTLISATATYDTLLANTRGGALYTIQIPTTSPMKPVVTPVRRSTWQGFENLVARQCGVYGTLLLGIDKDTRAGYLYAVGRTNGLATVIQSRGKVPGTFGTGITYFSWNSGS